MKIRGSKIVVRALEEAGVRFTFGIPGTHNVELYDALEDSKITRPILVTDEQSASFMADGISRTSDVLGVINLVPGAGVTHALSGIAEAFMDNVPMLILACGIRGDTKSAFQVHDIDQCALLAPITKKVFRPKTIDDLYPMMKKAIALATSGTPGPVAVEVPAEFYILTHDAATLHDDTVEPEIPTAEEKEILRAAKLLNKAEHPALYLGLGAKGATDAAVALAERLGAPVTTSISGKGVFPENHPLWLWNNFGQSAPSFVRDIMDECDCLLAVGCRFGEVATGSYGLNPPETLIHVDINETVFDKNYRARLTVKSDARDFLEKLIGRIKPGGASAAFKKKIESGHEGVREKQRRRKSKDKVSPRAFFDALQEHALPDAIYATDSGNGTFLSMEHLRLDGPGRFIAPVDFSCMGYCVPAAIGAKFANPEKDVIALAGDGALLMTGLELLTATTYGATPVVFVLRDGELAQILQLQKTSYNRDTCSVVGAYNLKELAGAVNCAFYKIRTDEDLADVVPKALAMSRKKKGVVVEVNIDYSHKTWFTKGIITTNFWRLPWQERLRMIGRAVKRRMPGVK